MSRVAAVWVRALLIAAGGLEPIPVQDLRDDVTVLNRHIGATLWPSPPAPPRRHKARAGTMCRAGYPAIAACGSALARMYNSATDEEPPFLMTRQPGPPDGGTKAPCSPRPGDIQCAQPHKFAVTSRASAAALKRTPGGHDKGYVCASKTMA